MKPIRFEIPIRTKNPLNGAHGRWQGQAAKRKKERNDTALCIPREVKDIEPRLVVVMVRQSPGEMDGDGLQAALKSVRDQLAKSLRVDDKSPLVFWYYGQRRGDHRVLVAITTPGEATDVVAEIMGDPPRSTMVEVRRSALALALGDLLPPGSFR